MTSAPSDSMAMRRLNCARCGTSFDCRLGSGCWCAAEPYRLPMPDAGQDCLYAACLRAAAAAHDLAR